MNVKWQRLVLAEFGLVTPRSVPGVCSWSRRKSGWHCRGRALQLPGAHGEAPAIRGAARTPGALLLQEQEEEEETERDLRSAALHHCMGPHYNTSTEIPIYCAVYTCI